MLSSRLTINYSLFRLLLSLMEGHQNEIEEDLPNPFVNSDDSEDDNGIAHDNGNANDENGSAKEEPIKLLFKHSELSWPFS